MLSRTVDRQRGPTAVLIQVRPRIRAHIDWLKRELSTVDNDLVMVVKEDPGWRSKDHAARHEVIRYIGGSIYAEEG